MEQSFGFGTPLKDGTLVRRDEERETSNGDLLQVRAALPPFLGDVSDGRSRHGSSSSSMIGNGWCWESGAARVESEGKNSEVEKVYDGR